jgi:hypothetical protein
MSRNSNSCNNQRTPFCKVCFDAKKPQSVYESHWVKDREGNVTCITLNSQECRYCFKNGHTVKHCPVIASQNAEKEKQARRQESQQRREQEELKKANEKVATKAKKTGFQLLRDDSDDEDMQMQERKQERKQEQKQVEEYPALPTPSSRVESRPSFASALKKPVVQVKKEETSAVIPSGFAVLTRRTNGTTSIQESKMPSSMPASVKPVFCGYNAPNWIDDDEDEDDDEDDDEFGAPPSLGNYRKSSVACDDW